MFVYRRFHVIVKLRNGSWSTYRHQTNLLRLTEYLNQNVDWVFMNVYRAHKKKINGSSNGPFLTNFVRGKREPMKKYLTDSDLGFR